MLPVSESVVEDMCIEAGRARSERLTLLVGAGSKCKCNTAITTGGESRENT